MSEFPFVQAPDSRNINDGLTLLEELQAIKPSKKRHQTSLTQSGQVVMLCMMRGKVKMVTGL